MQAKEVLTIGHSTLSYERFLELLRSANVNAIADVRSSPYSRYFPHFSREALASELSVDGVAYVYLGKELGGRPSERKYYCDGIADYELMSRSAQFEAGLNRVVDGASKYRIALMCSERDPLDCHRCLLVSRALQNRGVSVSHILDNGSIVEQSILEERLLEFAGRGADDFFAPRTERLAQAYRERARRVAFSEPRQESLASSSNQSNDIDSN